MGVEHGFDVSERIPAVRLDLAVVPDSSHSRSAAAAGKESN